MKKHNNMSDQAKAALWFAMCSILQKGISFITVPIFTRLLTAEQYGTFSLYLSWLQILTILTSLYLYHGVFNNGMTKFEEDRDVYISSMQGLTLTINAIVFFVYLVAYRFWSNLIGLAPLLIFLMFIEMAVTPAFSFWAGRQRFELKYKRLVAVTLAKSIFNPVLGLLMVWFSQDKSTARIASVVITEVIFCTVIMIYQFVKGKRFIHLYYWKYALVLAIPLIPHYLSGMILNQGDRIMINGMVGRAEVAFYSVAYSIGILVQIVTNAIGNSFIPWMYQKIKANEFSGIQKTVNSLLVIVAFVSFALMMCSPELTLIFGSNKYAGAAYVIPPVAASVFFTFLYNLLAVPQFYFEKTKFLAASSIIAAVVNIGLNYIFIKQFGYIAAGYTTLVCYVLYSFGHYIVSHRVLNNFLKDVSLYDSNFILGLSIIMILIGVGCNFLFPFTLLRYGILVLIFVLAYFKRNQIITLIDGIRQPSSQ